MVVIRCPECQRIKFLDAEKKTPIWITFTKLEETVIEAITYSELLTLLVGGLEQCEEMCDDCIIKKQN